MNFSLCVLFLNTILLNRIYSNSVLNSLIQVVYILDQVRALENEMLHRIKQQGLDIVPRILIVRSHSIWFCEVFLEANLSLLVYSVLICYSR